MKALPPIPPALGRQRYEALRQYVLGRRQVLGAAPLGLAVLFDRGVAGWMQSWREPTPWPSPLPALPLPPRCPPTPQWQQQLTGLLAHMTAQHLQRL